MKKLEKSGLPIYLDELTSALSFEDGLIFEETSQKSVAKLAGVLENPDAASDDISFAFYKGIHYEKDEALLEERGLRFDITVVFPGLMGRERKKTTGHIHACMPEKTTPHAELYEVLSGTAMYILQPDGSDKVITATLNEGDRILVPANCAHCTANAGEGTLVFDNLVLATGCNDYGVISENHGMALFLVEENGELKLVRNKKYKTEMKCYTGKPVESEKFATMCNTGRASYLDFVDDPDRFAYLSDPTEYNDEIFSLLKLTEFDVK